MDKSADHRKSLPAITSDGLFTGCTREAGYFILERAESISIIRPPRGE